MALNCLAPGYIKLFYTSNGHEHVQVLPCIPASVAVNFDVNLKGGGTDTIANALLAYFNKIKPFFDTADVFTGYEQFTQADCSSAPVFQGAGALVGYNGTGSGNADWVQAVMTYKTQGNGRFRLTLLEGGEGADQKFAIAGSGGAVGALDTYLRGSTAWISGRDNTYPAFPLNFVSKVNDKLRKKFLNP